MKLELYRSTTAKYIRQFNSSDPSGQSRSPLQTNPCGTQLCPEAHRNSPALQVTATPDRNKTRGAMDLEFIMKLK